MSTKITNTEQDLIQGVLTHGPDILKHCVVDTGADIQKYLNRLLEEHLDYPKPTNSYNKDNWLIPDSYKDIHIQSFLQDKCKTQEERDRIDLELELYQQHNMLGVLVAMKYVVDILRKNGIVWGVGRGSSVASYALYLIGVHKIDSIKYNIPIEEFFKGEKNG